jgi:hypothetical protein
MAPSEEIAVGVSGANRLRTAPAGGGHTAATSQTSHVREEQPGIRIDSVQTRHSTNVD